MTAAPPEGTIARVPRSDRAERIMVTAARMFRERGYHTTTIDDIGRAEGICGSALYRHFASKDDLLAAISLRGMRNLGERLEVADEMPGTPEERLARLVAATGRYVHENLDATVVSERDIRHLTSMLHHPIREQMLINQNRMLAAVRAIRPELSAQHVRFMMQSIGGMCFSIADFNPAVTSKRLEQIWVTMGVAAFLGAPALPVEVGTTDEGTPPMRPRASRREAILGVATSLFRQYGYGGVGIDQVGAAAGIAGPSVYRHFGNKDDILAAIMNRANEQMASGAALALRSTDAAEALDRLIASYVQLVVEHPDTLAVSRAEVESLAEPRRAAVRRAQQQYVDEWEILVSELAPGHNANDVRAAVRAALGLVNGYPTFGVRPPFDMAGPVIHQMASSALRAFIATQPA